MWWKYFVFIYENGKMRPVETIPGMGGGRMMEGVKSTIIYYKNFYKCHNVPQYNDNMIIVIIIKKKSPISGLAEWCK
jgi:hypothetical protein